jgi:CheY-like chemotaxis protein
MLTPKKILLVEDDHDDRRTFSDAMARIDNSLEIIIAENGAAALDVLHRCNPLPEAIFVDINMPVMNGIECLQQIKKNALWFNIPVFVISTSAATRARDNALLAGAEAYIVKPSRFEGFVEELAFCLNGTWN